MINSDLQRLILASASPRRLDLLRKIGIDPDIVFPVDIDEIPKKNEKPYPYVKRIACEKIEAALSFHSGVFIIVADTVVIRGSTILGKPKDLSEARAFLRMLSGKRHHVLTCYAVCSPSGKIVSRVVDSVVLLKKLSSEEIEWYLASNEWQGKSGGYALQGKFELFVKQINGSLSNIMGLPLLNVYHTLIGMGYVFNYGDISDVQY